jgi:DNA-binding transcriptional MocR family regulator
MRSTPDVTETARRFDRACSHFDQAILASHARDAGGYDEALLSAAREMGSALELAAFRAVALARPGSLATTPSPTFPDMLRVLRSAGTSWLTPEMERGLQRWRKLRNRAEHHPIEVPSLDGLLDALYGTRRFLQAAFGDIPALTDPSTTA